MRSREALGPVRRNELRLLLVAWILKHIKVYR